MEGKEWFSGPRNSKVDQERGDGRRLGNVLTLWRSSLWIIILIILPHKQVLKYFQTLPLTPNCSLTSFPMISAYRKWRPKPSDMSLHYPSKFFPSHQKKFFYFSNFSTKPQIPLIPLSETYSYNAASSYYQSLPHNEGFILRVSCQASYLWSTCASSTSFLTISVAPSNIASLLPSLWS